MESLIKYVQDEYIDQKNFPEFKAGDTITVYYEIKEGEKSRTQFFKGVVIQIKGVLNNETSALTDSFQDNLLAPHVYTRPANYNNIKVPDLLLSGNKSKIEDWREKKSIEKTKKIRPGLLK